jgi:putative transposase
MRIYRKIGFIVDQLHYSTIQELCQFQYILLPAFESQEMVKRRRNGLHSRTRRNLLSLQHFKFKTRLKDVVSRTPGAHLQIVTEHYTSKTCTQCGSLNTPSRDWYSCRSCGLEIDRDVNGARNILLKHLTSI